MARATPNAKQDPNAKQTKFEADFSNADDRRGGRSAHVPPGDYLLAVHDAEVTQVKAGANAGKDQVRWIFKIVAGEAGIGGLVYYYTSLDHTKQGGLWDLRNILSDLLDGAEIPKSKANIDLATKIGKRLGATLIDDEPWDRDNPDGTTTTIEKSAISMTFPASRYIGAAPTATPTQAPAVARDNGAASAVEVAAAIAQPAEEDTDIQPLAVVDL